MRKAPLILALVIQESLDHADILLIGDNSDTGAMSNGMPVIRSLSFFSKRDEGEFHINYWSSILAESTVVAHAT